MSLIQIIILLTGISAIGLTQQPWWPSLEKFAPIVGLLSQPFWLYETYTANQLGMFANSLIMTCIWIVGFKRYWLNGHQS